MKLKLILILVVFIVALTYFPACAKKAAPVAPEVEEPKGEIVIGILEDMSGPMGGMGSKLVEGELDAVKYIKEEMGGISGHPIKEIVIDFKLDATLATSGWERLKNADVPVIVTFYGAAVPIFHQAANSDHLPMVCSLVPLDQLFPKEPNYVFSTAPAFPTRVDFLCYIIEKEWEKEGKGRTPKVGFDFVTIGVLPTVMSKKARIEMGKRGWEYVETRSPATPADVSTQVLQMKNFGCDYVYQIGTEAQQITWLKELDRQGFKPRIYGDGSLSSQNCWNAAGEICVGARPAVYYPQWTDTDQPGIKLMHDLSAKWHPEVESRTGEYVRGFGTFMAVADVLAKAISDVGYENLNGETMKNVLENTTNADPIEVGIGYTWTPADHQGLHHLKWYEWTEEGIIAPVTDWWEVPEMPEEQRTDAWWYKD
jgi:branched-chain amino acid transport system substrate-binding protein